MIGPPGPPTATPSPAPIWPAASRRPCSGRAPVSRRWSTSRCWAVGCGDGPHHRADPAPGRATGGARPKCTVRRSTRSWCCFTPPPTAGTRFVMMQPTVLGRRLSAWAHRLASTTHGFASAEQSPRTPPTRWRSRQGDGHPHPLEEWSAASPPWRRTVGAGAGHTAGGRRCPCGPTTTCGPAGELELVANPVQFDVAAPVPGRARLPSRPTRSSRNSDWTGTGSSSSRPPAPSHLTGSAGHPHAPRHHRLGPPIGLERAHSRSYPDLPSGVICTILRRPACRESSSEMSRTTFDTNGFTGGAIDDQSRKRLSCRASHRGCAKRGRGRVRQGGAAKK